LRIVEQVDPVRPILEAGLPADPCYRLRDLVAKVDAPDTVVCTVCYVHHGIVLHILARQLAQQLWVNDDPLNGFHVHRGVYSQVDDRVLGRVEASCVVVGIGVETLLGGAVQDHHRAQILERRLEIAPPKEGCRHRRAELSKEQVAVVVARVILDACQLDKFVILGDLQDNLSTRVRVEVVLVR